MGYTHSSMRRALATMFTLVSLSLLNLDVAIAAKSKKKQLACGVCKALVREVRRGLKRTDVPQMNLDLRGRLDSKGNRHGKVVDYAVSESRAMDVLEDICKNMKDYSKSTNPDGTVQLVKMNNNDGEPVSFSGSMDFGGDDGGKLQNKCETLLEEYEEEITEHIRLKPTEALEASICTNTAKKCPKPKIEKLEKEL